MNPEHGKGNKKIRLMWHDKVLMNETEDQEI